MDPSQRPPAPQLRGSIGSAAAKQGLFPADSDTHLLDRLNAIYKYRYVVCHDFPARPARRDGSHLHDDADVPGHDERAD